MKARLLVGVGFVVIGAVLIACNGILGIEEAAVDDCVAYCRDMTTVCKGTDQQYFDQPTCERMCPAFAPGTPGEAGDTLACRVSELHEASQELANQHCPNAGPLGGTKCVGASGSCGSFCNLTLALCGAQSFYASVAECNTTCAANFKLLNGGHLFNADGPLDQSRNTLDCRMTHLEIAHKSGTAADHNTHCGHTNIAPHDTPCAQPAPGPGGTPDAGGGDAGDAGKKPADAGTG